jgi:hypothetical protein
MDNYIKTPGQRNWKTLAKIIETWQNLLRKLMAKKSCFASDNDDDDDCDGQCQRQLI